MIDSESFLNKLHMRAVNNRVPLSGTFELTPRCNLACTMCYVNEAAGDRSVLEKELTSSQWLQLAEEAKSLGLLFLTLTGGEVCLREDFLELYSSLYKMGFLLKVMTNGTLLTQQHLELFAQYPPTCVDITMYGFTRETCKNVTGNSFSTKLAMNNVVSLVQNRIPIRVSMTVIRKNMHEFSELFDFTKSVGIPLDYTYYVHPRRETGDIYRPVQERMNVEDLDVFLKLLDSKRDGKSNDESVPFEGTGFRCYAGRTSFSIMWDGRMTPCLSMPVLSSYPLKEGFSNAWDTLKKACDEVPSCVDCVACEERSRCGICPAHAWSETRSVNHPGAYNCLVQSVLHKQMVGNDAD